VQGEAIAEAEKAGRWSRELLLAAASAGVDPAKAPAADADLGEDAVLYLIDYRDGLKAAVAMRTRLTREFAFACRMKGDPKLAATAMRLDEETPFAHFGHLLKAIEHTFRTGRPAYPVERTLLTTGMLDALMHSLADGGKRIETPHLAIRYEAVDWPFAEGMPPAPKPKKPKS
jgi:hypothetical protein